MHRSADILIEILLIFFPFFFLKGSYFIIRFTSQLNPDIPRFVFSSDVQVHNIIMTIIQKTYPDFSSLLALLESMSTQKPWKVTSKSPPSMMQHRKLKYKSNPPSQDIGMPGTTFGWMCQQ